MRKKLILELFNLDPSYDWESKQYQEEGQKLLEESTRLKIFKEPSKNPIIPANLDSEDEED